MDPLESEDLLQPLEWEDLLQPLEWGVTDVETLGKRDPSEFNRLAFGKVLPLTVLTTSVLFVFTPSAPPGSSRYFWGARAVVCFALLMELVRGYLHFFFPYSSHLVFSGLADTCRLRPATSGEPNLHRVLGLALTAMVTHQFGAANLVLGFMYAAPLLFPDPTYGQLVYTLVVTFIVRVIQSLQTQTCPFFVPAFPKWLRETDAGSRKKAPPGKTFQDVQILLQIAGLAMAFAAYNGY